MNKFEWCLFGIMVGFLVRPFAEVLIKIIKNAYIAYKKDQRR